MLLAHAKWFLPVSGHQSPDWPFLLSAWTLVPLSLGAAAVALQPRRRLARPQIRSIRFPLAGQVPRALGAAVGAALVALALDGRLLTPAGAPDAGLQTDALLAMEAMLGAWLMAGVRRGTAGWALIGFSVLAAVVIDPLSLGETAYYPGLGAYLALTERAIDGRAEAATAWRALAVALGGSLMVVACTEKLAVPAISLAVLQAHPALDPFSVLGASPAPITFVRMAGIVEFLLGLAVATGAGGRLLPIALLGPFSATVAIFGAAELVGHLPIYAGLIALAARSDPQLAACIRARRERSAARRSHPSEAPCSCSASPSSSSCSCP